MRYLIVDDEYASRKILVRIFSEYAVCDEAEDGIEALDAVRKAIKENDPYNLISLDIMMPNMDGLKTLEEIRNLERELDIPESGKVKVIMPTGISDSENLLKALDADCHAFIVKPVDKKKLLEAVRSLGLI